MKSISRLILALLIIFGTPYGHPASAQPKNPPRIAFNSFTGVYHLTRDSHNVSLLSTEETILADFPGDGAFYGIVRKIPKTYQGHDVQTKILNVVDAAGNSVPYTTTDDKTSLVITTGDPDINLYGSQTIKIRYQTSGVIDLSGKNDAFLLNTNGRGWDQPFNSITATIYIPSSFQARLKTDPVCYTTTTNSIDSCRINTRKASDTTVITAKADGAPAHQSLVVKLDFDSATFTNQSDFLSKKAVLLIGLGFILVSSTSAYLYISRKK